MRTFFWFLGLLALGFGAIAVFTYPAWSWLYPHFGFPVHRVGNRIGMLTLLLGFLIVARHLQLSNRAALGYALPRAAFLRETGLGLVLGVATMVPIVLAMGWLGLRVFKPDLEFDALTILDLALQGLLSGLVVGIVEETFCRGAMYSGIARESGATLAILLPSIVYAATHFIGRSRIPPEQADWGSGVEILRQSLARFGDPAAIADAFLALFAVGVLLALVRRLTGNIAACIGLHAGWVWVIAFVRETTRTHDESPARFLVSDFDGIVGWLVLGWTVIIGVGLHAFYSRRASRTAPAQERCR